MSGYTGGISKGDIVLHKGQWKTIRDYIHVSTGMHNDDLIIVSFTDGTTTKGRGLLDVSTKKQLINKAKEIKQFLADYPKTK
jgi:hypothetical protein